MVLVKVKWRPLIKMVWSVYRVEMCWAATVSLLRGTAVWGVGERA
jgi:hypothetical protein